MHSEVEKLVERLRNYRPPTVDGYGYPPGQEPREHHTICDEAASLIERLYRERNEADARNDKLRDVLNDFANSAFVTDNWVQERAARALAGDHGQ